jgi:hypothetical protein
MFILEVDTRIKTSNLGNNTISENGTSMDLAVTSDTTVRTPARLYVAVRRGIGLAQESLKGRYIY